MSLCRGAQGAAASGLVCCMRFITRQGPEHEMGQIGVRLALSCYCCWWWMVAVMRLLVVLLLDSGPIAAISAFAAQLNGFQPPRSFILREVGPHLGCNRILRCGRASACQQQQGTRGGRRDQDAHILQEVHAHGTRQALCPESKSREAVVKRAGRENVRVGWGAAA